MKQFIVIGIVALVVIYLLRMKKAATQKALIPVGPIGAGQTITQPAPISGSSSVATFMNNTGLTPQIVVQPAYQDIAPAYSGTTAGTAYVSQIVNG